MRDDLLRRLLADRHMARRAMRLADSGEEHTKVIVDLRLGGDRRARVAAGGPLLDRNGRREPFDRIDVGLLQAVQELPRVGGEAFDVATLPFRVERIERQ